MMVLFAYLYCVHANSLKASMHFFVQDNVPAIAGALLSLLFVPFFMSLRQGFIFSSLKYSVSVRQLLPMTYAGMFANLFLPAGTGLDALRLGLLKRNGMEFEEAGSLTVLDRSVTLCCLLLLGSICFAIQVYRSAMLIGLMIPLLSLMLIVALCIVAFFWIAGSNAFETKLKQKAKEKWLFSSLLLFCKHLSTGISQRTKLMKAVCAAMLNQLCILSALAWIAWGIGGIEVATTTFLCAPLVLLLNVIPVSPGNLGWTEVAASGVWALFNSQDGLTVFVIFRILLTVFSSGGFLIWIRNQDIQLGEVGTR
jgi:uncharacterized protein (TIRG00374 family)